MLAALCNGLLDTRLIRSQINAREAAGMWVAGPGGIGGTFPMRSLETRAKRAAAAAAGPVGHHQKPTKIKSVQTSESI